MKIRRLKECDAIVAGDGSILYEIFNPLKDGDLKFRYSIAHARVPVGSKTKWHSLEATELYHILQGCGKMYVDEDTAIVEMGDTIYIPAYSWQRIENMGLAPLIFLCIVDPAWRPEIETVERSSSK
jgi:mannose-6-phosphate isomerase-like protein (cupin superfamily)